MDNRKMRGAFARAARMWLGFAALMCAAGSASASGNVIAAPGVSGGSNTAWTVYAFGNAQAVSDALRSLTNFAASGTFQSIVSMVAVIGVLGVGLSGGFNPAMAKRFIGYVVGVFITCYALFGVTNGGPLVVNIEVIDSVDNTWKAPVTVPAVVGIPASMISTAGYELTLAIEASFPLPDGLKMSKGAPFNLAAAMINDASQARITDPNLSSSLAYYVQDCFTVGVAQGALQAQTLINSTNFLNDIHFANKAIMVNTLLQPPVGQPGIVNCDQAWTYINDAVNAQGSTASGFLKNASAWQTTPALSVVDSAADYAAQYATNSGITDGGSMVKQAAVLSAFKGSYSQAAAQTGNSEFLTNIAMAQAVESQRTSWIVGAEIFNKTMGYIFAILQVFVYSITPLVLCAALVPGLGLALLKNFAQILLWLAIWQPMLAIVNFIVLSMQQSDLGGALSSGVGTYGFTLQNMGIITEKSSNLRAAASFVGTMTPALAWAMVKGSVDFSRVIGSAVGENFAAGAANTMTTGNYSLNNASMDSFTANKHSVAAQGAWGFGQTTASATGASQNNWGGTELATKEGQRMSLTPTNQLGVNEAGSDGRATQHGTSGGTNSAASVSGAVSAGSSHQSGGGTGNQSQISTQAGGSFGLAENMRIHGGGGGGSGTSVAPAGESPAAKDRGEGNGGATPLAVGEKPSRFSGNASARFDTSVTGGQTKSWNHNDNYLQNTSATRTTTGSTGATGAENASDTQNANVNRGYSMSTSLSMQGWASEARRSEMMQYANEGNGTNFLAIARDEQAAGRPTPSSATGQNLQQMEAPRGIQNAVEARQQEVQHAQDAQGAATRRFKANAEGEAKKNLASEEGVRTSQAQKADAAEEPATHGALHRLAEGGTEEAKRIYDATTKFAKTGAELAKEGAEMVKDKGPAALQALKEKGGEAGAAMAALGAVAEAGILPAGVVPGIGQKGGNAPTTPPGNSQNGSKPDDHQSAAKPGSAQAVAKTAEQAPGHQGAAPHGSTAQPSGNPPGGHQPEKSEQKPGDQKQGQQRESQPQQQVAEQLPPPPQQLPQVAQMPQPPVQQPEQPAQVAAVPQPPAPTADSQGQQQQAGLPNIFDGSKKDEGAGNHQQQAQVAEQQLQRSENQRRNADHVLASAENRKPSELPELINQARDFTRQS